MSGNLPDDVSHADIDDAFGGPDDEEVVVMGTVQVAVDAEAFRSDSDREKRQALMDAAEDGDIVDVLDATVEDEERR